MKILAIDTATECCSAALLVDGQILSRETETERQHAELILPMVDELLSQGSIRLTDLDAIAFGRGPGGFTGVRLATSVAQGLAFGANLPVAPISDLRALAQRVLMEEPQSERVLVCNDARMKEVYWACFERGPSQLAETVGQERVSPPADVHLPSHWRAPVYAAGRGLRAYPDIRTRLGSELVSNHDDLLPRAREIAVLAVAEVEAGRCVAPQDAVPVYLRDDVARPQLP
jgi:tRNA threonylcarbamoyladenosine biosynthesis protein TsaB